MIYTDYVTLDITSYDEFRGAVLNNGYDVVDGTSGCLSLDLANEFWFNAGFPEGYPYTAGTNNPYEVWTYATQNKSYQGTEYFELITNKAEIKRGDIIVCNTFVRPPFGQIGFADEDYNGSDLIAILSQDNGGQPAPSGGSLVNVANFSLEDFLGAFRFKAWHIVPPPPVPSRKLRSRLPLILLTRKQQNQNIL